MNGLRPKNGPHANRLRPALLVAALTIVAACSNGAAFPVPNGPPRAIALDVQLPLWVLGRWTIDGFSETLRAELAKYNVVVVDRRASPAGVAIVDLGRWTYRDWQEVDVAVVDRGETTPLGRLRVPDLSMTTLDVAAQSVAALLARWVWKPAPTA
jgi:hypothetical protein